MPEKIWEDRQRHFGLPLSFIRYSMSEDRLFLNTGVLNLKEEEILLYRVRDVSLSRSLGQRLFGVGTVSVKSSDVTLPYLELKNIAHASEVKELISKRVEEVKFQRKMRTTEVLDTPAPEDDDDNDDTDALD